MFGYKSSKYASQGGAISCQKVILFHDVLSHEFN
jgi:hypothetical protein